MNSLGRLLAAAGCGAALVGAFWFFSGRPQQSAPTRLTSLSYSDHDRSPAASPDGRMITFASDRDGRSRIWLKQLATDEEIPLTEGPDDLPRFSAADSAILFVRTGAHGPQLRQVTVSGDAQRLVLEQASEGDWSPDGRQVAFVRLVVGERPLWRLGIARADGTGSPSLAAPSELPLFCPRWSPDGKTIAVGRSSTRATADDVLLYEAATLLSQVRELHVGSAISAVAWNGDGRLLVAQAATTTTNVLAARIVRIDPATGANDDLLYQPNLFGGIDVLDDGRLIVESRLRRQNLREIAFKESGAPARWLSHGASVDRQPVYRPGSEWIAFSSSRSGNLDIWMLATHSGAIRHLIDHAAQDTDPAFTPDGRTLLWSSNRSGAFEIWAANADGTDARQVSHDGLDAENPTAAASGWVTYNCMNPAHNGIWKIRLDGTGAQRLVEGVTLRPEVSPDGTSVLYDALGTGERVDLRVARLADGVVLPFLINIDPELVPVPTGRVLGRARWTPDGKTILFLGLDPQGHLAIETQDFDPNRDTRSSRRVLAAYDPTNFAESFGISPDGARLVVALLDEQSVLTVTAGLPGISRPRAAPS